MLLYKIAFSITCSLAIACGEYVSLIQRDVKMMKRRAQCAADRCDSNDFDYSANCCDPWDNGDPEGPGIVKTCKDDGVIALTFDDGIQAGDVSTAEKLHKVGISATFFINGGKKRLWNAIDAIEGMGHEIASHTQHHCCLNTGAGCHSTPCSTLGTSVEQELKMLEQEYERKTNRTVPGEPGKGGFFYVRPPDMQISKDSIAEAVRQGYSVAWITDVTWDFRGGNCRVYRCLNSLVSQPASGSHIVLQHGYLAGDLTEGYWKQFQSMAKQNGWKFVTLDECVYGKTS